MFDAKKKAAVNPANAQAGKKDVKHNTRLSECSDAADSLFENQLKSHSLKQCAAIALGAKAEALKSVLQKQQCIVVHNNSVALGHFLLQSQHSQGMAEST